MAEAGRTKPEVEPLLLDVKTVAKLLSVSQRMVYRLKDAGRMPRPIKLGQLVRWLLKEGRSGHCASREPQV
ncbi:helix-turn-helix transcriptional regulator [Planctomycetota bacterium]